MNHSALIESFWVIWILMLVLQVLRMLLMQRHYLTLYRTSHPAFNTSEVSSNPLVFFGQISHTGSGIREKQEAPEIEKVRRDVVKQMQIVFTWAVIFPIVFFVVLAAFNI